MGVLRARLPRGRPGEHHHWRGARRQERSSKGAPWWCVHSLGTWFPAVHFPLSHQPVARWPPQGRRPRPASPHRPGEGVSGRVLPPRASAQTGAEEPAGEAGYMGYTRERRAGTLPPRPRGRRRQSPPDRLGRRRRALVRKDPGLVALQSRPGTERQGGKSRRLLDPRGRHDMAEKARWSRSPTGKGQRERDPKTLHAAEVRRPQHGQ